jgi:hypothetical protein
MPRRSRKYPETMESNRTGLMQRRKCMLSSDDGRVERVLRHQMSVAGKIAKKW